MAKKKSYNKQPKASASVKVWENYHASCKKVDVHNKALETAKKKKETIKNSVAKLKQK